jgi:ketosteroid isomerase-like protein
VEIPTRRIGISVDGDDGHQSAIRPMRGLAVDSYGETHRTSERGIDMTSAQDLTDTNLGTAERLSEALAEVFRSAEVGDVLTDDVFLDGNPPLWRFQLQGIEAFAAWYKSYAPNGMDEVTVVRTVPTASGFVTELTERNREDTGKEITGREIVLCTVRDGRISELTVYCSGDWDEELRARHAAEAPMLRP